MSILGCRRCYLRHGCGPLHTQRRARKAPLDSTYRNLGSREGRSPISRVLSPDSRTFRNVIREPWHLRITSNSHILNRPSYLSLLQEFGNDRGLVSMDLRVLPEGKPVLTLIVRVLAHGAQTIARTHVREKSIPPQLLPALVRANTHFPLVVDLRGGGVGRWLPQGRPRDLM